MLEDFRDADDSKRFAAAETLNVESKFQGYHFGLMKECFRLLSKLEIAAAPLVLGHVLSSGPSEVTI